MIEFTLTSTERDNNNAQIHITDENREVIQEEKQDGEGKILSIRQNSQNN